MATFERAIPGDGIAQGLAGLELERCGGADVDALSGGRTLAPTRGAGCRGERDEPGDADGLGSRDIVTDGREHKAVTAGVASAFDSDAAATCEQRSEPFMRVLK